MYNTEDVVITEAPDPVLEYTGSVTTILNQSSQIMNDIDGYLTRVSTALGGEYNILQDIVEVENNLESEVQQLQTELSGFNPQNAPEELPDPYVKCVSDLVNDFSSYLDDFNSLVNKIKDIRSKAQLEEHHCPNCEAPVDFEDDFCSQCGTELSYLNKCPNCDAEFDGNEQYCPSCGTELPENEENEISDQLRTQLSEVEELSEKLENPYLNVLINRITAQSLSIAPQDTTNPVPWTHCPNCGFQHAVYDIGGNGALICIVCRAQWEITNTDSGKTEFQMTNKSKEGTKKTFSQWGKVGKPKFDADTFEKYIEDSTFMDGTEIQRKF